MHDGQKVCTAIIAIAAVEITALVTGHNGTMLRIVIIALSGLGGFSLAQLVRRPK
jgi:hypothetical protein